MTPMFDEALTSLNGIGQGRAALFAALGLFSIRDLLYFLPRDYLDYSTAKNIADIKHGEYAAARVLYIGPTKFRRIKNGLNITTVSVADDTATIEAVWFNQPYISRSIPKAPGGYILGRMDREHGTKMVNAVFACSLPGIMPVYPLTKGLSQSIIRKAIMDAIRIASGRIEERISGDLRNRFHLAPIEFSIRNLHFPGNIRDLQAARRRLAFEDALIFTIMLEKLRAERNRATGITFETENTLEEFLTLLPFHPTDAQLRVMKEIAWDMSQSMPMNRLVQGDVGSGKTILALYAMFVAMKNGYQSVLMAPTEILAEQHYRQLKSIFGEKCTLIVGGMGKKCTDAALDAIRGGKIIAVTGTHALIEGRVRFSKLGLVITDEQHRFGVSQRALLQKKGGIDYGANDPPDDDKLAAVPGAIPDTMIMSATPIPRTLSLILYGDLDISILDDMPPGRKPVSTHFVPEGKRISMYRYIERCIKSDAIQAYVVCPMIEDNEELEYAVSAESVYEELNCNLDVRIDLMHGRLKSNQKEAVMSRFRAHETDILVSTTVIEVGVDVPNACIMVIESAERFGLAQLHQLRGRVGRGSKSSHCFLLSSSRNSISLERLRTLVTTNDGFKIAEKDLALRGPGEFLGTRQHGMSEFNSTALAMDLDTLTEARDAAIELMAKPTDGSEALIRSAMEKYGKIAGKIAIN